MSYNVVIIAAGGKGSRADSALPKQYHVLHDKPVLMHTISAFDGIADKIIVVLHQEMVEFWKLQCQKYNFHAAYELVVGGNTRYTSVRNGLQYLKEKYEELATADTAVAVHDGARPLVGPELIEQSFRLCHQGKGNVLGLQSTNSVRIGGTEASKATDRRHVWLIQTPQTFPADVLIEAFSQAEQPYFTDEASVVEQMGYNITILEGDPKNLKITHPEDFIIAQMYMNDRV